MTHRRPGTRFEKALVYAARLHANQIRKDTGIPYIAHLMAVAALVLEHGGGEDEAIAALLHDAIEDQGGAETRAEILETFGPNVARIVEACTDAETIPKPPWRARKEAYLARIASEPREVLRVALSDKLHNARAILSDYREHGEALWDRFRGGREGTLWYYRALVETFGQAEAPPSALLSELDRTVTELERLADDCSPETRFL